MENDALVHESVPTAPDALMLRHSDACDPASTRPIPGLFVIGSDRAAHTVEPVTSTETWDARSKEVPRWHK